MICTQRLFRKLRNKESGNEGFTLVELLMVLVISVVILAGVVVLLSGTFDIFKSNRNLLAITDSSRRALSAMCRQLRGALHFVNYDGNSDDDELTFYADVTGENYDADVIYSPDWVNAPKIKWWFDAAHGVIKQTTTKLGEDEVPVNLASDVEDLKFEYYASGSNDPIPNPQNYDVNKNAARISITVTVKKDYASRRLSQDVSLRVLQRVPEQEVELISSVTPAEVARGWSGTVTIVGTDTHFVQGQSVVSFVPSKLWMTVDPGSVVVNTPTELTVYVQTGIFTGPREFFEVHVDTGTEKPFPKVNGFVVN